MRRPHTSRALISLAGLMVLAACGSSPSNERSAAGSGTPTAGGTLRLAVHSDAGCVDPHQVTATAFITMTRSLADSLTDQDPATGKIVPWLAESWKANDDSTSFTFDLREGVTFSDGSPLNADVVKANFDKIVELGAVNQTGSSYLAGYEGTTVASPTEFTVKFSTPNAQFLQATTTTSLSILSLGTLSATPERRCQGAVVGTGPFVFESYTPDQNVMVKRREGYGWSSAAAEHSGDAYLDAINFQIVPESGVRAGALISGEVDAMLSVEPQDIQRLDADGLTIYSRPSPGIPFHMHPNAADPILSDLAVRQAIQMGINRSQIAHTVQGPDVEGARSVLSATTPMFADMTTTLAYRPDEAAKLLDDAGWKVGEGGIRAKDGNRLTVTVQYEDKVSTSTPALELAQQQLLDIGVDLRLSPMTAEAYDAARDTKQYQLRWFNFTRADPDALRTFFGSANANTTNVKDAELDALLDKVASTSDPERRATAAKELQTYILEHGYAFPVIELSQTNAAAPDVRGLAFDATSRFVVYDVWKAA
ncbi:peptide ABC transporter permease [Acrocarpospora pleiomorpha]|uniref:Peptide ABC transporter permease n=1 Tax=Acrocarpospora pleiomorpha TaxID=90975 RepID=A0A5M3XLE8_9ACTN|nr:ABC transporter substrate-binding protein [Acrocarpospora pleiomorpha]GES19973.1 peptide ABC transporter permease [Acrocarpospora pleiomorpha]